MRFLYPPCRIVVYREDLMGFSHVPSSDGLSDTLLSVRAVSLEWLLVWEWWVGGKEPLL